MYIAVLLQISQSLVEIALGPLYSGTPAPAEAAVASKRGPSVVQPYRDLAKPLHKSSATSDHAPWVFGCAAFVAFADYLTVSAVVKTITNEPLPHAFLADRIGGASVLITPVDCDHRYPAGPATVPQTVDRVSRADTSHRSRPTARIAW